MIKLKEALNDVAESYDYDEEHRKILMSLLDSKKAKKCLESKLNFRQHVAYIASSEDVEFPNFWDTYADYVECIINEVVERCVENSDDDDPINSDGLLDYIIDTIDDDYDVHYFEAEAEDSPRYALGLLNCAEDLTDEEIEKYKKIVNEAFAENHDDEDDLMY